MATSSEWQRGLLLPRPLLTLARSAAAVTAQIADCLGASTANDALAKAVLEARATFDA
jgi:hypothetical protein